MTERVLARRLAHELSADDVSAVHGGECWFTQRTICQTYDYGTSWPDVSECDGGLDCDF
jgi:hypothetical protein